MGRRPASAAQPQLISGAAAAAEPRTFTKAYRNECSGPQASPSEQASFSSNGAFAERRRLFSQLGRQAQPAVLGQAPSILGVQNHTSRADRNFRLTIRAMSCSAAPASARSGPGAPSSRSTTTRSGRSSGACSATGRSGRSSCASSSRSPSASAHARVSRRRRQHYAESQDCTRKCANESAILLGIELKEGMHGKYPSGWDELPKKHTCDEIIRAPRRLPRDYAPRDPRDSGAIKIEMNMAPVASREPLGPLSLAHRESLCPFMARGRLGIKRRCSRSAGDGAPTAPEPDAPRDAASRRARVLGSDARHAESQRRDRR